MGQRCAQPIEYKPLAAWPYGPVIGKIEYGINDHIRLLNWDNGLTPKHYKINYETDRPYIVFYRRKYYLDEALRCNLGGDI